MVTEAKVKPVFRSHGGVKHAACMICVKCIST